MLTTEQVFKIKEHLERAQNPIFFFDNDPDGLCSFLLLQKWIGRGKGVAIKSFPALDESYFRRVEEFNADYIFILDKPVVSNGFFERVKEKNIPVVWIDHHAIDNEIPDFINYFNPAAVFGHCEPVTTLCYQITQKKQDLWIAIIGSIADGYIPDFYAQFLKTFPDLGIQTDNPFEILYNSRIGEVTMILSDGLKDTTTNVVKMLKFLISIDSPYDVLEENSKNFSIHKRAKYIRQKYEHILDKAKSMSKESGKLLFFKYSGDLSVSGEIANHLKYLYPKKSVLVAYVSGSKVNLSMRGKNIRDVLLKVIPEFQGASGGGHNDAVGGQMNVNDLDRFRKRLDEELKND
jgi:single-stranded DNA-specific DHH superfamily exonuclease